MSEHRKSLLKFMFMRMELGVVVVGDGLYPHILSRIL